MYDLCEVKHFAARKKRGGAIFGGNTVYAVVYMTLSALETSLQCKVVTYVGDSGQNLQ